MHVESLVLFLVRVGLLSLVDIDFETEWLHWAFWKHVSSFFFSTSSPIDSDLRGIIIVSVIPTSRESLKLCETYSIWVPLMFVFVSYFSTRKRTIGREMIPVKHTSWKNQEPVTIVFRPLKNSILQPQSQSAPKSIRVSKPVRSVPLHQIVEKLQSAYFERYGLVPLAWFLKDRRHRKVWTNVLLLRLKIQECRAEQKAAEKNGGNSELRFWKNQERLLADELRVDYGIKISELDGLNVEDARRELNYFLEGFNVRM